MADLNEDEARIEEALVDASGRQPELPPGFTASVMRKVHSLQSGFSAWRRWRRARLATNFSRGIGVDPIQSQSRRAPADKGGVTVGKKILWGAMGLGAAAVVSMFILGIPPVGPGTEATVGAAKRYQGARMGDKDVVVGSMDVQKFLQTDTFDRIMKNDAARNFLIKASQDLELQKVLFNPALTEAFANAEFSRAFFDADFQEAFANVEFQKAFTDAAFQKALTDAEFQRVFMTAEFRQRFADVELQKALMDPEFQDVLMNAEFRQKFADVEFQKAFTDVEFQKAFTDAAFQKALAEPAFQEALANPALFRYLSEPAFQQALGVR